MTRLRVLFAIPDLSRGGEGNVQGGPEGVFSTLLARLDRERFEPLLAVHDATASNMLDEIDDVPVISVLPNGARLRLHRRYPVPELTRVVRSHRPDVVLSTLRMDVTAALARPFFPRSTAFVSRLCNNITGSLSTQSESSGGAKVAAVSAVYKVVLRQADTVIAQSNAMARDFAAHAIGDASDRIVTVPNPVDTDRLLQRARAAATLPAPGAPTLVTVGRLHHQKGYDLLLPAFAAVRNVHPNARLWIVGDGPDRAALERQARGLGVADAVEFIGFVENPAPLVAAADLYVCSSRYEGFSNALAEALAVGTPALAPAGRAAGDDLVTAECGELIEEATEQSLTDGMLTALGRSFDPTAIRASVEARFSAANVLRRYEDVLAAASERRRVRR